MMHSLFYSTLQIYRLYDQLLDACDGRGWDGGGGVNDIPAFKMSDALSSHEC